MSYVLVLGDRSYSSWSLRAWLLVERFKLPIKTHYVKFNGTQSVAQQLVDFAPARTVPTLRTDDGIVLSESIAIAEELATRFSDRGLWPSDANARAVARNLTAEMHAGFGALRTECPMNLRASYSGFKPGIKTYEDLRRLETIWGLARSMFKGTGPWLCGTYSIADAFFAPIAARIAGYGLCVDKTSTAYVQTHLQDSAFRRWRAMGLAQGDTLPWYKRDFQQVKWPGPAPLPAVPVASGPSQNALCPYSNLPVTHFLQASGKTYGFCNAFCRDKTVNDALAFEGFRNIYQS